MKKEKFFETFNTNKVKNKLASSLNDRVSAIIGMEIRSIQVTVESHPRFKDQLVIKVTSDDFAKYTEPRMFKSLRIYGSGDYDENRQSYWLSLNYSYDVFTGGSNGTKIAGVEFTCAGNITGFYNELQG